MAMSSVPMPHATPGARRHSHQRVLGRCLLTFITDRKVKCLNIKGLHACVSSYFKLLTILLLYLKIKFS